MARPVGALWHSREEEDDMKMTADELRHAREVLGERWGLGRPLQCKELGKVLRLKGRDVGRSPCNWEAGLTRPPGPSILCIELMLDGARPRGLDRLLGL